MSYITIVLAGYIISALMGILNKRLSYFFGFLSSIMLLFVGILNINKITAFEIMHLTNSITLSIKIDKISAVFLIISAITWAMITLYSIDYGQLFKKNMAVLLNLTIFGMVLTFIAYDMITLLIGYEIMTIGSYLLINSKSQTIKGAFSFLAFSELSTVLLILAFAIKFVSTDSVILDHFNSNYSIYFIFTASIGFIIKMDIIPFHIWLKEAYSKAPSNVLAILSSSVTLVGVYGIFRVLSITDCAHSWAIFATLLGAVSAFYGATQAASTKGIKILPAYSTIENNGLILSLLGLYALVVSLNIQSTLSTFAYIGAIILAFAHSLSKTLLFLSIGHAKEMLAEDEINNIRGIHSSVGKIPAYSIMVSGLSFSAFPPLIGYVAEWIVLESIFQSYQFKSILDRIVSSSSGVLMALAMGFGTFAMIKLIGYSALGYDHEKRAKKISAFFMNLSELLLIILIFVSGISITYIFTSLGNGQFVIGALAVPKGFLLASAKPVFGVIAPLFYAIVITFFFIFMFLLYTIKKRHTKKVVSWNGGLNLKQDEYFTSSAYSYTVEFILRWIYLTKEVKKGNVAFVSISDIFDSFYGYIVLIVKRLSLLLSRLVMNGKVYQYIIYIVLMFLISFAIFK